MYVLSRYGIFMDFLLESIHSIYTLIYIAVIILGGVTLTLTVILNAKEKTRQHRAILFFISSIFFYMITDFITYYFLGAMSSGRLVFILITLSDTLFCVMVAAWIYALLSLARTEEVISIKWLVIISVVYLITSQALSIYLGRYGSYAIQVESGIGNIILQILNASYDLGIIAIGIRFIYILCKKYQKSKGRAINIIMAILLMGYMIWIMYWDYSTWFKEESNLLEIYAMDPLILMYAILNVFLIYYFYKTDPLEINDTSVVHGDAISSIAHQYGLSEREQEVLSLVNKGMSNRQVANELFISENTVKRHMSNIFKKTGTQNRHEVILKLSKSQ